MRKNENKVASMPYVIILLIAVCVIVVLIGSYFISKQVQNYNFNKNAEYMLIINNKKLGLPREMGDFGIKSERLVKNSFRGPNNKKLLVLDSERYDGLTLYGYNPEEKSQLKTDYTVIGFSIVPNFKMPASFLGVSIGDDTSKIAGAMSKLPDYVLDEERPFIYFSTTKEPQMYIKFWTDENNKVTGFELVPM